MAGQQVVSDDATFGPFTPDELAEAQQRKVDRLFKGLSPDIRTPMELYAGVSLILGGTLGNYIAQTLLRKDMLSNQTELGLVSETRGSVASHYFTYFLRDATVRKHAFIVALTSITSAMLMHDVGRWFLNCVYLKEKAPGFVEEVQKLEKFKQEARMEMVCTYLPFLRGWM
jgi:hypothetical protein